jgi:hypothetical protein
MMAEGTSLIALTASPSPAETDQAVLLTATVTPTAAYASVPSGTVQFEDGTVALGAAVALDGTGKAVYKDITLTPGTHSLVAVYSGDSTYPTLTATQTLVVGGLVTSVPPDVDGGVDSGNGTDGQIVGGEGVDALVALSDAKTGGKDVPTVGVDSITNGADGATEGAGGASGSKPLPGVADAGSPSGHSSGCCMIPTQGGHGAAFGLASLLLMALSFRRRRR